MNSDAHRELLEAMDERLDRMEDTNLTKAWTMAQERSPHLVNDQHKLLFLRFEDFHVELACIRMLRYWSMRLDLFGEEKAFQRMSLDKTLKDDQVAVEIGEGQLIGTYDNYGRGIFFDAPVKHPKSKNKFLLRTSLIRTSWYMMECALEDESILENGIVGLMDSRDWGVRDYDAEQMRLLGNIFKCFPIRVEAFHICYCPWLLQVLMDIVVRPKLLGILVDTPHFYHAAKSPERILRKLEQHGIPRSSVPVKLGGMANLDYQQWLQKRRELETMRALEDESATCGTLEAKKTRSTSDATTTGNSTTSTTASAQIASD